MTATPLGKTGITIAIVLAAGFILGVAGAVLALAGDAPTSLVRGASLGAAVAGVATTIAIVALVLRLVKELRARRA